MGAVSCKKSVMVCGTAGADLLFMVCLVGKAARRMTGIRQGGVYANQIEIWEYEHIFYPRNEWKFTG